MSRYDHRPRLQDRFLTRRELLARMGNGFAALGLAGVLGAEGLLGAAPAEARRRARRAQRACTEKSRTSLPKPSA
jgi:hypothetical protein